MALSEWERAMFADSWIALVSGTNNHYLNDQNALRDQLSRD